MPKPKGKKKPSKPAGNQKQAEEEIVPSKKVFVGNLSDMDMTEAKLRQLFEATGEITAVDLVTTSNHVFGFVEFQSIEEAETAIEKMNGENGLLVKFAKNVAAPRAPVAKAVDEASEDTKAPAEDSEKDDSEESEAWKAPPAVILPAARTAAARDYPNPVESLQEVVQKATRATSTKDHILYNVEDADLDGFVATVEVIVPDGRTSHRGEPRENKREAKKAAAKAALRDPALHSLLPPLPPKVKEAEAQEAVSEDLNLPLDDVDDKEVESEADSKPCTAMSAKQQRQLEKEELRAKKLAKKKAAKAFKAALAAAAEEESEEEEEENDEEEEDSEESDSCEDTEEEDSEEEGIDAEALAAKKAAIKAALAAKRKQARGGRNVAAVSKDKDAEDAKKKAADKSVFKECASVDKVKENRLQANFGQTKFIKP